MSDEFNLVRRRLDELAAAENNLRAELDRIEAERKVLAHVEDVMADLARRFEGESAAYVEPTLPSVPKEAVQLSDKLDGPKRGTARPEGIPTVAEMVDAILIDAEGQGKEGLTGQEIVKAINDRWWPGVDQNNILPTALRHVKQGRLGRSGALYVRAQRQ